MIYPDNDTYADIEVDQAAAHRAFCQRHGVRAPWDLNAPPIVDYIDEVSAPHRLRHQRLIDIRDGRPLDDAPKRTRQRDIAQWVRENIGAEIDAHSLSEGSGCSLSSAYTYLNAHRSDFRATEKRGTYVVLDADLERQRASKSSAAPATLPSNERKTRPGATAPQAIAADVLDAMTGAGRFAGGGAPA